MHTERFLTRRGGGTHWEEIQIALSVLTEEIHAEHDVLGINFIETDTKIHIIKRNNLPSEIRICYLATTTTDLGTKTFLKPNFKKCASEHKYP